MATLLALLLCGCTPNASPPDTLPSLITPGRSFCDNARLLVEATRAPASTPSSESVERGLTNVIELYSAMAKTAPAELGPADWGTLAARYVNTRSAFTGGHGNFSDGDFIIGLAAAVDTQNTVIAQRKQQVREYCDVDLSPLTVNR